MADHKKAQENGRLERLTHNQFGKLSVVRDHWQRVRLAVGPADRDRAEAGVAEAYHAAELAPPVRFVWLGSPQAGEVAADILRRKAREKLPGQAAAERAAGKLVTDVVAKAVLERVWDQVARSVSAGVQLTVLREVTRQIDRDDDLGVPSAGFGKWFNSGTGRWSERYPDHSDWYDLDGIAGHHCSQPWLDCADQIHGPVRGLASSMGRGTLHRAGRLPAAVTGHQGARGLSWFAALGAVGAPGTEPLGGLMEVAQSSGWWWPFENVVVMCERPVVHHRDADGRLHCGDGPALLYPDGSSLWAWHGRRVPADLILGLWDAGRILTEENAEIRRCAIERLGWPRFIVEGGFVQVSDAADDPANPGQTLALYDVPDAFQSGAPLRLLLCTNATVERDGTRRSYGLRVPARFSNPVAAAAWTFGLNRSAYAALVRAT